MYLLIVGTIFSFLSVHSSALGQLISAWRNRPSSKEKELLTEKRELKHEQHGISMMNEFAKYSKLQRKINAIDKELSETRGENNKLTPSHFIFAHGLKLIFGFILVILTIWYRGSPVFTVDKRLSLAPFHFIISYPNESNVVSFHFWVLCCTAVAKLIKI